MNKLSSHNDRRRQSTMSEEEKQRKLQEMQQNAKWREENRVKSVRTDEKEERNESTMHQMSHSKSSKEEATQYFK